MVDLMLKPRTCPSCSHVVYSDRGYFFDDDLNMVCGFCQKFILFVKLETSLEKANESEGSDEAIQGDI